MFVEAGMVQSRPIALIGVGVKSGGDEWPLGHLRVNVAVPARMQVAVSEYNPAASVLRWMSETSRCTTDSILRIDSERNRSSTGCQARGNTARGWGGSLMMAGRTKTSM
jgi:hypothetical protein